MGHQHTNKTLPIPDSTPRLVKWLNCPTPEWLNVPSKPRPRRGRSRDMLAAQEAFLRVDAGFLIPLLNSRPDVAPPGWTLRKPRARTIEGRRRLRGWMLDDQLRKMALVLKPDSSPRNELIYRLEPDAGVTGFKRRRALVALAIHRLHSDGTLKHVKRCRKCERWYESRDPRSHYCSRRCANAAVRATPEGRRKHAEDNKERQIRRRVETALPTFRKELERQGYCFVRAGACKKCGVALEYWREPRRRKGLGRPPRPILVPLKINAIDGDRRVRAHWPHSK